MSSEVARDRRWGRRLKRQAFRGNGVAVTLLRAVSVAVLLLSWGCATQRVETISGAQFVDYGASPLSHTVYLGSDGGYHYFAWSHGKSGGRWKVPDGELIVTNQFALGGREAFLLKRPDGEWCAYPCE